jgi:hypothetical protein
MRLRYLWVKKVSRCFSTTSIERNGDGSKLRFPKLDGIEGSGTGDIMGGEVVVRISDSLLSELTLCS